MSEHLSTAQLQKYGARAMPPREASLVIAHLDECPACFAAWRGLFPALANPQHEVAWGVLPPADEVPFHLAFTEHLRPFVDGEADDVTNEIVTSHIAVCPSCGQALRELQEFRDSLRWQQAAHAAPGPWARLAGWWQTHSGVLSGKSWAWALSLLLACGVGAWFAWRWQTSRPLEVARQTPTATPTPGAVASAAPAPTAAAEAPPAPTPKPAPSPEVDAPPPNVPAEVAQAIRTQKLTFPAALNGLGLDAPTGERRGGPVETPPTTGPAPQTPLGVTREARPLLRWGGAEGRQEYQVAVTDTQGNIAAVSPKLTQTNWRPAKKLPPGRLRWQVKATDATGRDVSGPAALIYRLSPAEEAKLQAVERATDSPLARGVAYAQAGLLTEAAQALRQWLAQHPASETARKLLAQVEAK